MKRLQCSGTTGREAGSAYLAVLLVLVILTIMGLSLATVTSMEMEIGSAERTVTRVFYGADSGIAIATAAALTSRDYRSRALRLFGDAHTPQGTSAVVGRAPRVQLTHTVPLLAEHCNLCSVNENELQFFKVNHAMTSTATELRWSSAGEDPPANATAEATKVVAVMIEVQPFWQPPSESIDLSQEDLNKIKF
jgi:hypothetical protein